MTPEEAYKEALRRICEAEKTGAVELDLRGWNDGKFSGLESLNRLPQELERLTSLQSLMLSGCIQLSTGITGEARRRPPLLLSPRIYKPYPTFQSFVFR